MKKNINTVVLSLITCILGFIATWVWDMRASYATITEKVVTTEKRLDGFGERLTNNMLDVREIKNNNARTDERLRIIEEKIN